MASTAKTPTAAFSDAWGSPTEIYSDNASYASIALNYNQFAGALIGYHFHFAIPAGATINGVTVTINAKASATSSIRMSGSLYTKSLTSGSSYIGKYTSSFVPTGNAKSDATYWGTSDGDITLGSSSDVWGSAELTPDYVNSDEFGFSMACINKNANLQTAYVDVVTITITYTEASGPALLKSVNGLVKASVKTVSGLAIASVKTWDGLA
jgi:hypothetical protein